ncbi:MAG: type II toxin-antitoxin system RelE/ParE family toxin [Qipengyuania sp.]|nr:type II toxin-antitoxin system RelE/ParE family toxin [Qipengyuania sp.]
MTWSLEIGRKAEKQLAKLPKPIGRRIVAFLREVAASDNPRLKGLAMAGRYGGHWRYRIGDYRVIAKIIDERVIILVVEIGHRREIYR